MGGEAPLTPTNPSAGRKKKHKILNDVFSVLCICVEKGSELMFYVGLSIFHCFNKRKIVFEESFNRDKQSLFCMIDLQLHTDAHCFKKVA